MKRQIDWLSDALANKSVLEHMQNYCMNGTHLMATDGKVVAAVPYSSPVQVMVPGDLLEKMAATAPATVTLSRKEDDPDTLYVAGTKFKATLPCKPASEWQGAAPDGRWEPIPEWLPGIITSLAPFMSDDSNRMWANGIGLMNEYAYATNTRILARSRQKLEGAPNIIIPRWGVEFVAKRLAGLESWVLNDNHIGFRWAGGSWARMQLIEGNFSDVVEKILLRFAVDDHPTLPPQEEGQPPVTGKGYREIPAGYAKKLEGAAKLLDIQVEITPSVIRGTGKQASVEHELDAPIRGGNFGFASYMLKDLVPVVTVAKEFDPTAFPNPTPFRNDSIVGVVSGMDS